MTQCDLTQTDLACLAAKSRKVTSTYAISNGWGALFAVWRMRARSRAALARLSVEQLADIGISSTLARREAAKWFWQA